MNNTLKIFGLIITFCAFACLGYFYSIEDIAALGDVVGDKKDKKDNRTTQVGERLEPPVAKPQIDPREQAVIDATNDAAEQARLAAEKEAEEARLAAEKEAAEAARKAAATPKDLRVVIAERRRNEPKKVSRTVTVSAKLETARMECIIKDAKTLTEVKRAELKNGSVTLAVAPSDDGQYVVAVRNIATGDEASVVKSGFDKISKWDGATVRSQLNSDNRDRFLRHHFDLDKLSISCVQGSEVVSSLDELLEVHPNGGAVEVVGAPKYDKYNRITNISVKVTY